MCLTESSELLCTHFYFMSYFLKLPLPEVSKTFNLFLPTFWPLLSFFVNFLSTLQRLLVLHSCMLSFLLQEPSMWYRIINDILSLAERHEATRKNDYGVIDLNFRSAIFSHMTCTSHFTFVGLSFLFCEVRIM